jgi:nucleotide-binding universal stress UspA family protein
VTAQRLAVALDGSPGSLSALRAAAILADALEAELVGVFVEDESLARLAQLPMAREVQPRSGAVLSLDPVRLEGELRAMEARARLALRREADRHGLETTFVRARGRAPDEVIRAAGEARVVAVGRVASRPGRALRFGSTASGVIRGDLPSVLLVEPGRPFRPHLYVVYDGSSAARAALALAMRLAGALAHGVTVLLPPGQPVPMAVRLGGRRVVASVLRAGTHGLLAALRPAGGCVLLPAGSPLTDEPLVAQLLAELHCAVLLVQREPAAGAVPEAAGGDEPAGGDDAAAAGQTPLGLA